MHDFLETSRCMAEAVRQAYQNGEDDYNMKPLVLVDKYRKPIGTVKDGDSVIFCCKRGEREVQLTDSFVLPDFGHFPRRNFDNLGFVIFTLYHQKYLSLENVRVAFKPQRIENPLARIISENGLRQLHIAESEKFAHVTYFFNGGTNTPYPGEDDVKIPSPRGIPFEQVPQLSLPQLVAALEDPLSKREYDFIVVNFANGDVIGHTPNFHAKVLCAEAVDRHLERVVNKALESEYTVLVTADHGILEMGIKPNGEPNVSHTTAPVPFIIISKDTRKLKLKTGKLANVASTVLQIMGLNTPADYEQGLLTEGANVLSRKVVLIILDGWGIGNEDSSNPIHVANTRYFKTLTKKFPFTVLEASGESVGLLPGKPGNSEAGHMNIGAGRIVQQDDVIIQKSIEDGSFFTNPELLWSMSRLEKTKGNLHLIGLLSEKSSHGNMDYLLYTLRIAKAHGLTKAFLHVILDGRSTEPGSAPELLAKLGDALRTMKLGTICTVVGRGIALDRSGDYVGKTRLAYNAMVFGEGKHVRCDI
ncbi:MAG: Phosphoglycerate mutase, 2,3-bisphosphoglycerate-independent [Thermotoga sp. 50_1627]|uniref:phosphoglycerate mutase (2,3-diphosphoglycerate-independent) n=1 Tax=Pseudothermotoga sp. TaxID=2033661 RepID=UPI00076CED16|nr:MAG: Phosphoglycerate mutase, 2,3-bisphosphoglycerate-independent [Thermotoga sp. 50_1627]MBC7116686.1 phosphoglycerate mutase (2,3-diphosphoglycerate-independent) [Pseudothermotoga sp.]MDK2922733.1 2,3-bisphosphoglycerate-independent phosphoglycerate mutase [Pseudothermotoga sp.]